jgi:hypothetical protein
MKILKQIEELFALKIAEMEKRGFGSDRDRLERILLRIYVTGEMTNGDVRELRMLGFLKDACTASGPFKVGQKVRYTGSGICNDIETVVTGVKWSEEFKCRHVRSEANSNWLHEGFYQ